MTIVIMAFSFRPWRAAAGSMIERKGIQTMIDMRFKERAAAGTLNMSKEEVCHDNVIVV